MPHMFSTVPRGTLSFLGSPLIGPAVFPHLHEPLSLAQAMAPAVVRARGVEGEGEGQEACKGPNKPFFNRVLQPERRGTSVRNCSRRLLQHANSLPVETREVTCFWKKYCYDHVWCE